MENVTAAERVLDLMIALINVRIKMTREQIRQKVNGYQGKDDAAFERMFERDKDLLRDLGVPLVTVRDAVHEDDVGYRIDVEAYRVPDADFTPQELGILALAGSVHAEAAWRAQADRGVTKTRGLGSAEEPATLPLRLALRIPEDSFEVILEAIESHRQISFTYSALKSPLNTRKVEPWRVVNRQHGWYLIARDLDREAPRAFRLSRIVGAVNPVGAPGAYDIPAEINVEEILGMGGGGLLELRVALAPERAALLRARGRAAGTTTLPGEAHPRDVVALEAAYGPALVQELASYGADLVVLEPPELRAAVIERFAEIQEVRDGG